MDDVRCFICNRAGSILKRLKGAENNWIHGLCAIFHGYYANITKVSEFRLHKRFRNLKNSDKVCLFCKLSSGYK